MIEIDAISPAEGGKAMIEQQPFYDLPDVSRKLGNISRSTIYRLIEQRKLVRVNIGSKAVITGESLIGYIDELKATYNLAHDSKLERAKTMGHARERKFAKSGEKLCYAKGV